MKKPPLLLAVTQQKNGLQPLKKAFCNFNLIAHQSICSAVMRNPCSSGPNYGPEAFPKPNQHSPRPAPIR